MKRLITAAMIGAAWLAGCAPTSGARPEDMSAEDHRAHAARHDAEAAEHEQAYDPRARAEKNTGTDKHPALWEVAIYNPTERHLDLAAGHREHAANHRAAADALETFEEAECGAFPPATRAACPLMGTVEKVEDIGDGVRVTLAVGVDPAAVVDHVRCHLAFAQTRGRKGMPHCPLYVTGVSASLEDRTLELRVDGDEALAELRRRAHEHAAKGH